ITNALSAPVDQREVVGLSSSKELGVICLTSGSGILSIFTLR
ncbi:MAG: hypothetical protein RIQ73_556, partial [Actinomycetota bacterium]